MTADDPRRRSVEQLWWTRSPVGLSGSAGFQVRAASEGLRDPQGQLFRSVYSELAYGITHNVPRESIPTEAYPRCLALVQRDGIRSILQKRYTGDDGAGRQGNYFIHAVVGLPASIRPRHIIALWRSDLLRTEVAANEDDLRLPPLDAEEMLRVAEDRSAAWRLEEDLVDAAALVIDALLGGLSRSRSRLYLIAAPDVVASLVRAGTEAVPDHLVDDLTFSTFEDAVTSSTADIVGTCWQERGRGAVDFPPGERLHSACYASTNQVVNCFCPVTFDPDRDERAAFAHWAARELASASPQPRETVRSVRRRVEGIGADPATMVDQILLLHRLTSTAITPADVERALVPETVPLWWDLSMEGVLVRDAIADAAVRHLPRLDPAGLRHDGLQSLLADRAAQEAVRLIEINPHAAEILLGGLGRSPAARLQFESALRQRCRQLSAEQRRLVRKCALPCLDDAAARAEWLRAETVAELEEVLSAARDADERIDALTRFGRSAASARVPVAGRWGIVLANRRLFEHHGASGLSREYWLRLASIDDVFKVLDDPRASGPLIDEALQLFFEGLDGTPDERNRWELTLAFPVGVERGLAAAAKADGTILARWLATTDLALVKSACVDRRLPRTLRTLIATVCIDGAVGRDLSFEQRFELVADHRPIFEPALERAEPRSQAHWLAVDRPEQLEAALKDRRISDTLKVEMTRAFLKGPAWKGLPADDRWALTTRYAGVFTPAIRDQSGDVLGRWLATSDLAELARRLKARRVNRALGAATVRAYIDSTACVAPGGDPWPVILVFEEHFIEAMEAIETPANAVTLFTLPAESSSVERIVDFLWQCERVGKAVDPWLRRLTDGQVEALVERWAPDAESAAAWLCRPGARKIAARFIRRLDPVRLDRDCTRRALAVLAGDTQLDQHLRDRALQHLRAWWIAATRECRLPATELAPFLPAYFPAGQERSAEQDASMRTLVEHAVSDCNRPYQWVVALVAEQQRRTPDEVLVSMIDASLVDGKPLAPLWLVRREAEIPLSPAVIRRLQEACRCDPDFKAELDKQLGGRRALGQPSNGRAPGGPRGPAYADPEPPSAPAAPRRLRGALRSVVLRKGRGGDA